MSEYQTEISTAEPTQPTPLDSILDSGDSSSGERSSDRDGDFDGSSETSVQISALRAERERRKAKDKEFEQLEKELEEYNNAKWGIDEESLQRSDERLSRDSDPERAEHLDRYNKSFSSFTAKHGKERVAAVDAALPRLNAEQWQQVQYLVHNSPDPASSVVEYIEKIGLLDPAFKALSLEDVLAGKKQPEPAADTAKIDHRLSELTQREQAIVRAEQRAVHAASRSDFVAEYGRESFAELDAVAEALVANQHPAVPQLAAAMQASQDPVRTAAELLTQWGIWSPAQSQPAQHHAPVMPSNFTGVRNAGVRRGPTWTGPTALNDIFDRRRA